MTLRLLVLAGIVGWMASASAAVLTDPAAIDAVARATLERTGANGLAIAVIDSGEVKYVQAYGRRNAQGEPLQKDTVMYGASLTKLVFATLVMQRVDAGALRLDEPLAAWLEKPLPEYPAYAGLADDPRWKQITPRMALTHSTGFANFFFLEPDRRARIHFDPGSRYAYSGEGLHLLQFAMEHGPADRGLGIGLGELANAWFQKLGMTRTSLQWRDDFAGNLADGWNDRGEPRPHSHRSRVRVAGSMDTTIADFARFAAAFAGGDGLSKSARAEMVRPQLPITTAHQFPTFLPELPPAERRADLSAGLGLVTFTGRQGPGYYKGGHDGQTANTFVGLERTRSAVLILSNDVRAEAGFAALVQAILGETGVPYDWEYGDGAGKSNE